MLLVLQHAPAEGLGRFGPALAALGHTPTTIPVFRGAPIPTELGKISGVISLGGEMNVDEADRFPWIDDEVALLRRACGAGLPVLGVCLGSQLLTVALGGTVSRMASPEVGWHPIHAVEPDPLFSGLLPMIQYHYHGRETATLAAGATRLLSSAACPVQGYRVGARILGLQFHLEWGDAFIRSTLDDSDVRPHAQEVRAGLGAHYAAYHQGGTELASRVCAALFGPS